MVIYKLFVSFKCGILVLYNSDEKNFSYILVNGFDGEGVVTSGSSTELLVEILLSRFVFPFELVSFVLLAALIGGITLARKDEALIDEDQV